MGVQVRDKYSFARHVHGTCCRINVASRGGGTLLSREISGNSLNVKALNARALNCLFSSAFTCARYSVEGTKQRRWRDRMSEHYHWWCVRLRISLLAPRCLTPWNRILRGNAGNFSRVSPPTSCLRRQIFLFADR